MNEWMKEIVHVNDFKNTSHKYIIYITTNILSKYYINGKNNDIYEENQTVQVKAKTWMNEW